MTKNSLSNGKRILGIDYGTRRIGLAVSDPMRIIAQSLTTIKNDSRIFDHIQQTLEQYDVELIIVGMPYNLKGVRGEKALEVERFLSDLRERFAVEILEWDERFTTKVAHRTMIDMGTKKTQRQQKGRADAIAASLILQSYLDAQRR